MAPPKKAAPAAKGKNAKGKAAPAGRAAKSNAAITLISLACITLAILAPSACIIIPGLLPALSASIIDRDKEKAAAITVGAMNVVGVAPVLFQLWKRGHDFDTAFQLLAQPTNWLIMYGAAGVGWLFYFVIPGVISGIVAASAVGRIQTLRKNLDELKRLWGPEVG